MSAPVELKIKYVGKKTVEKIDAVSISLDGYGLNFMPVGDTRFTVVPYGDIDSWEAKSVINEAQKKHSEDLLVKTSDEFEPKASP